MFTEGVDLRAQHKSTEHYMRYKKEDLQIEKLLNNLCLPRFKNFTEMTVEHQGTTNLQKLRKFMNDGNEYKTILCVFKYNSLQTILSI